MSPASCVFVSHLQEELAFVFEMLQQFEDALVQYDELDALFTQYVLNFGAGGKLSHSSPLKVPYYTHLQVFVLDSVKVVSPNQLYRSLTWERRQCGITKD